MVKFSPADVTGQSNADSAVVTKLAICYHPSLGTRRAESKVQRALGRGDYTYHMS